jgi:hypothetical protein
MGTFLEGEEEGESRQRDGVRRGGAARGYLVHRAGDAEQREHSARGGAVQVDSLKIHVESACGFTFQRLKLRYDNLLSIVAFKFNLRR